MKFIDLADAPGAESAPGVKYVSDCGQWRVAAAGDLGAEWYVWQRLTRPDPIADPRGWGYVRRASWAVFEVKEQAMMMASLLDAMPATLSGRVVSNALSLACRSAATRLLFVGVSAVAIVVQRARRAAWDMQGVQG